MMDHVRVTRKVRDTPTVFSLYFNWNRDVEPGQFVMVWVPGHSEVPMSLSQTGKEKCLTIKMYGDTTKAMDALEPGDFIYIRGPYGKPFSRVKGKTLLIGGGSGMASLRPMINEDSTGILAARGKEELLFENEFHDGKPGKIHRINSSSYYPLYPPAAILCNAYGFSIMELIFKQ